MQVPTALSCAPTSPLSLNATPLLALLESLPSIYAASDAKCASCRAFACASVSPTCSWWRSASASMARAYAASSSIFVCSSCTSAFRSGPLGRTQRGTLQAAGDAPPQLPATSPPASEATRAGPVRMPLFLTSYSLPRAALERTDSQPTLSTTPANPWARQAGSISMGALAPVWSN